MGLVYDSRGDYGTAVDYYQLALTIQQQIGDRTNEVVTRFNLAGALRAMGRLAEVVSELEVVVALDRAMGLSHLESDSALLTEVRAELTGNS